MIEGWDTPTAGPGRPREVVLNAAQERTFVRLYLAGNRNRKKGSMSMAWRVTCEQHPEIGWEPHARESKHQVPECVRELARRGAAMVPLHRGGAKALMHATPDRRQGGLRLNDKEGRRILRAIEELPMRGEER